jgi:hypothetical protein
MDSHKIKTNPSKKIKPALGLLYLIFISSCAAVVQQHQEISTHSTYASRLPIFHSAGIKVLVTNPAVTPTPTPPEPIVIGTPKPLEIEEMPTELNAEQILDLTLGGADADCDGKLNKNDNCPLVFNPDQKDIDGDEIGDTCDADLGNENKVYRHCDGDSDGIYDAEDNCPLVCNPDQKDKNKDGTGDVCDFKENNKRPRIQICQKTNSDSSVNKNKLKVKKSKNK